ncbi:MAG: T9SS type A sorting domain-containing protein [Bacteroidetes bacterium]|nr:T9SS type A sorting domain-containing protein [Bacteroidota bacterium]
MRKAYDFIILLYLCLSIKIIAQNNIIPNGNFENSNSSVCIKGVGNGTDFDDNIANWKMAEHSNDAGEGWPDWLLFSVCQYDQHCSYFDGLLVNSNAFVAIKADIRKCKQKTMFEGFKIKRTHEAIAVGLENGASFAADQAYTIRYKIIPIKAKNIDANGDENHPVCINLQTDCQLRVFLTKKGYNNWNDNLGNIKQELYSANYATNSGENVYCNWIAVEGTFVVDYAGMKNLILYAESGGFIIDDVEIFQKCAGDYLIQNKSYDFPLYAPNSQSGNHFSEQSGNYINAGFNVGSTTTSTGNVVVKDGTAVVYTAANKITLKPGFKAESGSYFHALIDYCPNAHRSTNNIDTTNSMNDIDDDINILFLTENKIKNNGISIIPNPNSGSFTITITKNDKAISIKEIKVFDIVGKVIWETGASSNNVVNVDISDFSKGVYYLRVTNELGEVEIKKLVLSD